MKEIFDSAHVGSRAPIKITIVLSVIKLFCVTNESRPAYAIAGYNYYISGRGGIQMGFGGFGNNNGGCGIIIIIIILLLFFCFNDDCSSSC